MGKKFNLLSLSNTKLAKDGIATFNLPAGRTCPGAGECRRYCYACKGNFVFPAVRAAHARNLAATKRTYTFFRDMLTDIDRLVQRAGRKRVRIRIHSSGDFYDQQYLDTWVAIMASRPKVQFYCYTKSLHLKWGVADQLPNFSRTQSMGGKFDTLAMPDKSVTRVAKIAPTRFNKSDLAAFKAMKRNNNILLGVH